jgi:hypothetical protein
MCLEIISGAFLASDSTATVEMSFDGKESELPGNSGVNDIDMFREIDGQITDITHSRDLDNRTVAGSTSEFGKFITGAALHSSKPANAIRQQIFVNAGEQIVTLREITNLHNVTSGDMAVTSRLDKSEYRVGDTATITVIDPEANLDPEEVNTVSAGISSTRNPAGIVVELTETDINTSRFEGTIEIAEDGGDGGPLQIGPGSDITLHYIGTHARMKATINGISESGIVEMSDAVVDVPDPDTFPFAPIGGAANLTLVDASLSPDGSISVSLSYANAALGDQAPETLRMWQQFGSDWMEITLPENAIDLDAKTVTGQAILTGDSAFLFTLSAGPAGGGGGFGGGLALPGAGVVLDFVAPIGANSGSGGGGREEGRGGGGRSSGPAVDLTTFSTDHFEENPLEKIEILETSILDSQNAEITQISRGEQITVHNTLKNYQLAPQSYAYIIQVTDENGFTIQLEWETGLVESGGTIELSRSWVAEEAGPYSVQILIWDGISNAPVALSEAANMSFQVVV